MSKEENKKKLEVVIEQLVEEALKNHNIDVLKEESVWDDDPLLQTFIQPFTDVIKTAKAEAEKITATAWNNVSKLAKQTAVLAIPFLAVSMIDDIEEEAEQKLQQRIGEINSQYADVLERNWNALRGRDVWGLTFLLNPTLGLGQKMLAKAPGAALGLLSMLTGGNPKVKQLKQAADKLGTHVIPGEGGGGGAGGGGLGGFGGGGLGMALFGGGDGDGGGMGEGVNRSAVHEQQQQQQQPAQQTQQQKPQQKQQKQSTQQQQQQDPKKVLVAKIQQLLKDPSVRTDMENSKITQEMRNAAFDAISDTLKPVLAASTYDQLKNALGKEFEKFEQELKKNIPEESTPEQIEKLKEEMVPEIKELYKNMAVKKLQDIAKQSPTVKKQLEKAIQQIKSS